METSKRRRSKLVYIIQQLSKGSSEGSGIILVVQVAHFLDLIMKFKTSLMSMVDVSIHQEDLVVQRTPLIDTIISMVTEKTTSTPTPPTTQAQVTNVSEFVSSSKFEQRLSELEMKVKTMPKRAWIKKDQKTD
ncbi:hypothetical protein Tco_1059696 [Tanacetum coccineum]